MAEKGAAMIVPERKGCNDRVATIAEEAAVIEEEGSSDRGAVCGLG